MTEPSNFQISTGLHVLSPRSDHALPIPCEEWDNLKTRISKLDGEPWFIQSIGSLLLGSAVSAFFAAVATPFEPAQQRLQDIAVGVGIVSLICGVVCAIFANKERKVHRDRAGDIISLMNLIEKRFDRTKI